MTCARGAEPSAADFAKAAADRAQQAAHRVGRMRPPSGPDYELAAALAADSAEPGPGKMVRFDDWPPPPLDGFTFALDYASGDSPGPIVLGCDWCRHAEIVTTSDSLGDFVAAAVTHRQTCTREAPAAPSDRIRVVS